MSKSINLGNDCICEATLPSSGEFTGIYVFYNTKYFYVGQSVHVRSRLKEHKSRLSKGTHENIVAQRVYNKYKETDPFIYKPLLCCDPNDLDYFEEYCFNKVTEANPNKTAMNISKCGSSGNTEISRKNKSESFKGRKYPTRWVKYVQLDKDGNLIKIWDNYSSIKEVFGNKLNVEKITSGGYQWQKYDEWLVNPKGKVIHKHNIDDSIKQFSLDGEFIEEFKSSKDILEKYPEISKSSLYGCLNGSNKSCYGFIWSYNNTVDPYKGNKKRVGKLQNIYQYDLNGNLIKEYKSVNAAFTETGITAYDIKRCASNIIPNAGGFIWKYQKETEI